MALVAFHLSMPTVASWNGRWSGDDQQHVRVVSIRRPDDVARVIDNEPYYYDFGDGWSARVAARLVDQREARRLRRQSAGFAGYDWMIDEIRQHGRILPFGESAR